MIADHAWVHNGEDLGWFEPVPENLVVTSSGTTTGSDEPEDHQRPPHTTEVVTISVGTWGRGEVVFITWVPITTDTNS
jgi:hypothetical protein